MKYKIVIILSLLAHLSMAQSKELIHNFDFNNTLIDTKNPGVALEVFSTTTTHSFGNREWSWTATVQHGGGLTLRTNILTNPNNYSVGFRVKYTEVTGRYKKLLSFKGPADDNGLYFHDSKMVFYPFGVSDKVTYQNDTFYDFVFSRSRNDSINVYMVDGAGDITKIYAEKDIQSASVPSQINGKYEFGFFMDDTHTASEFAPGGTVRGIRVWDYPLTAAEIGDALSSVSTGEATNRNLTGANINGSIDPKGTATDVVFEYGTSTSYGMQTSVTVVSGDGTQTVSQILSGLTKGTTYHYRIKATEQGAGGRTFFGSDRTFKTLNTFNLAYLIVGNGTSTGNPNQLDITEGTDGTPVEAIPNAHYHFKRWSDGVTTALRTDTNIKNDIAVVAEFEIDSYDLIYTSGSGGTLSGDSTQRVFHSGGGTPVSADPKTNYHFVKWSDGETVNPRTDLNLLSDYAVQAEFEIDSYTIKYVASAGGSITGTETQIVNHGDNTAAVTANPDANYHFVKWSDDQTLNTRTDVAVESKTYTAEFAIDTHSITYTAGANGTITGTSPQTIEHGSDGASVTAVPDPGYKFAQWDDLTIDNPRTDLDVVADGNFTASFALKTYTLTYNQGASGTISGTSLQSVDHGADGTAVTAVPNTGFIFKHWSDGLRTATRSETSVTNDTTVTAVYADKQYTLIYLHGTNGSLSGLTSQTIFHGQNGQAVQANPDPGYHFIQWSDGDATNPRTDINVVSASTVTAEFEINTYTATYNAGSNGSLTGTTSQSIEHGSDGTPVTAIAATNYKFEKWSDDVFSNPRSDLNVTSDITVTATFVLGDHSLNYAAGANGSLSGDFTQTVTHGTAGTEVIAIPDPGFHFVKWDDGLKTVSRTDNGRADINVIAEFNTNEYTITYIAGPDGVVSGDTPQTIKHGLDGSPVLATADTDYHFVQWSDGNPDNPRTDINVTATATITALFEIDQNVIVYDADPNGTISGSSTQTIDYGSNGSEVTAVPNANYHFLEWSDQSVDNPRTDLNVITDFFFTARFELDFFTIYYSAGPNGTLSGSTLQVTDYDSDGTAVTAIPAIGYHFVRWDDGSIDNPRTDLNIMAASSYIAEFAIDKFTLTYQADANGSITGISPQDIDYGSSGTEVSAVANTGYHFAQWDDGETDNPRTDIVVKASATYTAGFDINNYTINYVAGANGLLTGTTTQNIDHGANGTEIAAVPNTNYHFVQWSDGSTDNPRTDMNVTSNQTYTAEFAIDTFTLNYVAGSNGTISGNNAQSVSYGGDGSAVEAVPAVDHRFVKWDDGSTENPRTDIGITSDQSFTAEFALGLNTLTYTSGVGGTLAGDSTQTLNHGSDGTEITAVPRQNYHFVRWTDGSTSNPRTDLNVTADVITEAEFSYDQYSLVYTAEANGTIQGQSQQSIGAGYNGQAVEAVPAVDYHFVQWSDGNVNNPRSDTGVMADLSVTAQFAIDNYSLTYNADNGGSVTGDLAQTVAHGQDGTSVEAIPDLHWYFIGWSDQNLSNPRQDLDVKSSISAIAGFAIGEYQLKYSTDGNGEIDGNDDQMVFRGDAGSVITAVPYFGYKFSEWSDGVKESTRTDTDIKSDHNVVAIFAKDNELNPIYISEGVSPNNDGINDYWNILFIEDYPNNQVRIMNRYGQVVFEKSGYDNGSNSFQGRANTGTLGTGNLPEGTYFYTVDIKNGKVYNGYFTLLR